MCINVKPDKDVEIERFTVLALRENVE